MLRYVKFTTQMNYFPHRGFETARYIPKLVTLIFKVPDELPCFDSEVGLRVESPDDGRDVEPMCFQKTSADQAGDNYRPPVR